MWYVKSDQKRFKLRHFGQKKKLIEKNTKKNNFIEKYWKNSKKLISLKKIEFMIKN